jgi:hypothetical protein
MSLKKYLNTFLGLLSVIILFHIAIVVKIIPYDIAWGGRLQNDSEMFVFEAASIAINLFLVTVLLMKGHYLSFRFQERTINIILWVFFSLFILNTIGNIFAKTTFEKSFSILTLLFAFLIWAILRTKESSHAGKN